MIIGYYLYKQRKGKGGEDEQSWSNTAAGLQHHSTPLSALRDPSEFGPPPKRTSGGTGSPQSGSSSSAGLGSAASAGPTNSQQEHVYAARTSLEEPEDERPPPVPRRAETTVVSKPSPPVPPPRMRGDRAAHPEPDAAITPLQLPPRPPMRESGTVVPNSHHPAYEAVHEASGVALNQGAIDRLSKAGVSVPSLGIGGRASPSLPPRSTTGSPARPATPASPGFPPRPATASPRRPGTPATSQQSQLSELEERFARMRASSIENGGSGTMWAQKRAAVVETTIKKDPPSAPVEEDRIATSAASSFRDHHAEQAPEGIRVASALNRKFGTADHSSSTPSLNSNQSSEPSTSPLPPAAAVQKKKPPPPPPPRKKKDLS